MKKNARSSPPKLSHASPRHTNSQNPTARPATSLAPNSATGPFHSGAIVLVTLNNPREKFWGAIQALDPAGVSLRGVELSSFDDAINTLIAGESFSAAVLFFPMHRVEHIALDLPEGSIPSLSQRFTTRTGLDPTAALARAAEAVTSIYGRAGR